MEKWVLEIKVFMFLLRAAHLVYMSICIFRNFPCLDACLGWFDLAFMYDKFVMQCVLSTTNSCIHGWNLELFYSMLFAYLYISCKSL